jgi:hypothetical protein
MHEPDAVQPLHDFASAILDDSFYDVYDFRAKERDGRENSHQFLCNLRVRYGVMPKDKDEIGPAPRVADLQVLLKDSSAIKRARTDPWTSVRSFVDTVLPTDSGNSTAYPFCSGLVMS